MSDQNSKTAKPLPYANKGDLTTGAVHSHLIRMTVPMVWGIFAVIAVQLVDTYFISMIGDTNTLAGFSFTFPVTMVISHFVFGLNIAMSSVVSRLQGQKDIKTTKRIVLHGLIMACSVSAIISGLCYIFIEPLFLTLGADETTLPYVLQYMPLWLISSIILAIPVNGNSAIRASGDTTTPAIVMTTVAVFNAILDPIFIFGYFGLPAMGVEGAALATLIATSIAALQGLYFLIVKKKLVACDGLHLDQFKDSFKRLAIIAIPAGIGNIIMPATGGIIIALLANYGPEAVAAYGIVSRIEAFALIFIIALSLGMAPIVGQNWGAERYNRVRLAIKYAIQVNFVWSFLVALILVLAGATIAQQFSQDPQVIEYTVLFFTIVPVTYAFGNLVFGWASAFNAMGKPQRSFVMIFVKAIILLIPALLIGAHFYDVKGIFIAIALVNIVAGLTFHVISRRICSPKNCDEKQADPPNASKQTL